MPYLPGGGANQAITLRAVLEAVDTWEGDQAAVVEVGDGQPRPLGGLTKILSPAGLTSAVEKGRVAVTQEARTWLASDDPFDLLAVLHRHIRFVGEMLALLAETPRQTGELHREAADRYRLVWTTKDQTGRRLTWLTALGMVERRDSRQWQITERGRAALERLVLGEPDVAPTEAAAPDELPRPPDEIAALLADLDQTGLAGRNPILGYVPGAKDGSGIVGSLSALVNACSPQITRTDLLTHVQREFAVSESSFGAVLTTLTRSGLVHETALGVYAPTAPALAWLETSDARDLVLLLHTRYRFLLEIIPLLEAHPEASQLAKIGHEQFGLTRVDTPGIQRRLQLLTAAKLIYQRSTRRYAPTPLGMAVAASYPLQDSSAPLPLATTADPALTRMGLELVEAGFATDDPARLEELVTDAFAALGFQARHVGGAGRTDVLATIETDDRATIRVIIDAKAARSGVVSEGSVSFDTLREHQKQHNAHHVVLVGPSFDSGRTRKRAEQNHVQLLTTSELARVLDRHHRTPMSPQHYLDLIEADPDRVQTFESRWQSAERLKALFAHVTTVLAQERQAGDKITSGALTPDQIYLIVRDEIDPRPDPADIEHVLALLEHPLLGAVTRANTGGRGAAYRLRDEPLLVAAKLQALTASLATASE